ncbi:PREDICTED: uncharacterized protein LOC106126392 [Papilio xuthus]|uniref:Uncharacterized protein LOC106126392 n=1 Tax=Papilio xuthus TaxID=66420 RepID=A0A194PRL6_PAPXU|nr:PREDICTED: uncharacterized protein LOC106126392 [Papilio xuthus]XP_013179490.1 PREDICTED: uncharacterized protein LOC106126392 [Papilio xuthus]KPI96091.1 hypothetical protein RR46_06825 [Papilio xuthus]
MLWNVYWELGPEDTTMEPRSAKPCAVVRPSCFNIPQGSWFNEVEDPAPVSCMVPATFTGPRTFKVSRTEGGVVSIVETRHLRFTFSYNARGGSKIHIRRIINEYTVREQVLSPYTDIMSIMKRKLKIRGSAKLFQKRLNDMGYFWYMTNRTPATTILLECTGLRRCRQTYIQAIKKYRAKGRPIIYLSKYFDYKSQRGRVRCNTFTLTAHSATGPAPHSIDMYEIENNENAEEEKFMICKKWIRQKVIPNIPPNAVIVLVNLPSQNRPLYPDLKDSASKLQMQSWLLLNRKPIKLYWYKSQLPEIIRVSSIYAIDDLFKSRTGRDHPVLRFPPQHYDLDITHLFWCDVFFNLNPRPLSIRRQLRNAIERHLVKMTVSKLNLLQSQLAGTENEYQNRDSAIDRMTDNYQLSCDLGCYSLNLNLLNLDTRYLSVLPALRDRLIGHN